MADDDASIAKFTDLVNAKGTLFTAPSAELPRGVNKFWIQQHQGNDNTVGRTVVEFYTDDTITAIVSATCSKPIVCHVCSLFFHTFSSRVSHNLSFCAETVLTNNH